MALVWREGDDEEGVLTYQQLSTSVRKISRVIQKVTSSSSPFSPPRSRSPSLPPGWTRPPAYLFTSLPNHRRRASRLRQGWETSHIGRWMIGMIMPCSKSSKSTLLLRSSFSGRSHTPANVIINVHLIAIIKMFTIFLTIKISNIIINMRNAPPMLSSTINCR